MSNKMPNKMPNKLKDSENEREKELNKYRPESLIMHNPELLNKPIKVSKPLNNTIKPNIFITNTGLFSNYQPAINNREEMLDKMKKELDSHLENTKNTLPYRY